MLKFIVIGVALFLVYKLFMGDKKKREVEKDQDIKAKVAPVKWSKTYLRHVCGKDGNIRVREGEKVHVFCSYECRDKYMKQLESITVETSKDDK